MIPSSQLKMMQQGQIYQINNFYTSFSQSQEYEPQIKKIGKWTPSEHKIFQEHFFTLGDNPSKFRIIAEMLQSRSSQQVRSHAQKYFQKQFRHMNRIGKRPSDIELSKDDSDVRKTRACVSGKIKKSKRMKLGQFSQKIVRNIILSGPSESMLTFKETDRISTVYNQSQLNQHKSNFQIKMYRQSL